MVDVVRLWWSSILVADRSLLDLLDETERDRVRSLRRAADQGRSMVAAALLRTAVGDHLGVPPDHVRIDRTCAECGRPHGRPRVLGPGASPPHVSVSHSGVLVVVALAAGTAVGVDVQRVADLGEDDPEAARRAGDWVRREAVVKLAPGSGAVAVRGVTAPLDGYAAALATRTERAPTDAEVLVRHWPGPPSVEVPSGPSRP